MRLACVAVVCALAAGCSHTQANVNGGASVNAQFHSNTVTALFIMGMFLASSAQAPDEPARAMDPNRAVIEQDCSGPIDPTVTLKCR